VAEAAMYRRDMRRSATRGAAAISEARFGRWMNGVVQELHGESLREWEVDRGEVQIEQCCGMLGVRMWGYLQRYDRIDAIVSAKVSSPLILNLALERLHCDITFFRVRAFCGAWR
jgi:hypothetical protein